MTIFVKFLFREDPNNRSSKDVAHLNPATDFYKRLALDCSGAQIAVDLFLLNSQYADLSTISECITLDFKTILLCVHKLTIDLSQVVLVVTVEALFITYRYSNQLGISKRKN